MDFIYPETAEYLFERVELTLDEPGLQPEDRIRRFRIILEELFRALTSDVPIQFTNLHARTVYIFENHCTPKDMIDEINGLRNFANPVHHQWEVNITPAAELTALHALCEAISHFAHKLVPEPLAKRYEGHTERFSQQNRPHIVQETYEFRAVVLSVIKSDPMRGGKTCSLTCQTDDFGTILLKFWNNKDELGFGSDLSSIAEIVLPYTTIFVTQVRQRIGHEGEFYATESSMVVLEPDYLVEVKDIAESRQLTGMNENIQLLNRFSPNKASDKMMLGNLVGAVFDDLVVEGSNYDFEQTFARFCKNNAFSMLALSTKNGQYEQAGTSQIKGQAKKHEDIIRDAIIPLLQGRKPSLEPTFLSVRYGIQGRLDAMLEHTAHQDSKDVLELKSGSTIPAKGVWPNNEAQALLYNLLLESVWPERRGLSSILYSAAQPIQIPLRNVNEVRTFLRQDLLMLRNRIVANEMRLAAGDTSPILNLSSDKAGVVPRYLEGFLSTFSKAVKNASTLERDYFLEYCCFIFRELRIAKVGSDNPNDEENLGFSALWKHDKSEKLERHAVLLDLRIKQLPTKPDFRVMLTFEPNPAQYSSNQVTNLRKGDIVVLYPTPDLERLEPLKFQVLKGTIDDMSIDGLTINLANKELNPDYFKQTNSWAVEHDFRESTYKIMFRSMFDFLLADQSMRDLLLGLKRPLFGSLPELKHQAGFSGNQLEVVRRALSAKDYFLIQGPPGTGKTSDVLTKLVSLLVNSGEDVLVVAFTNQAIDEICKALNKKGFHDYIRLGRGGNVERSFEELVQHFPNLEELHAKVMQTKVFLSTQATLLGRLDLFDLKTFHTVIMDEASQLLEPQLVGVLAHCERFILLGDEKQLSAIVQQPDEMSRANSAHLHEIGLTNMRESLFYRLLENARRKGWSDCYSILTHHHRMHEEVGSFVNTHFYEGKLEIFSPDRQKAPNPIVPQNETDVIGKKLAASRVVFFSSKAERSSKTNEEEARLVVELVRYIQNNYEHWYNEPFNETKHLGVIAPFRAQIGKIRQLLQGDFPGLLIDTVERFQGSERDIILISYAVRSLRQLINIQAMTPDGRVDRKLNVTLSRAKNHVVIIGCEDILRQRQFFKEMLDHCHEREVALI